jgi:aspartate racemase
VIFARSIGIIGGMGPFAGAALLERVLRVAHVVHGARENHEYPRVLHASLPARSLVADTAGAAEVVERVRAEAALLRAAGAEVLAVACLTMHAYLHRIAAGGGEWVSLVEVGVAETTAGGAGAPLVLASPSTVRSGLFTAALEARGLRPVRTTPAEDGELERVIHALVAGADVAAVAPAVERITRAGRARGADAVLLGCTELSPFAGALPLPAVDPLVAAARALCAAAAVEGRELRG